MKQGGFRRFISRCMLAFLSLFITLVIVTGALYAYIELQLPNVASLRDVHMQEPLRIYTREGQLISEYGSKKRIPVTLDQVPKQLIQAVLAVEDARFYDHPGVDIISLVRAAKAVISSGRKVQGASTITMQVARNFFLTKKKTYSRKIKEILLALKIDKEFSKDKVLELYLNKVYFGNHAYGVAAAAHVYYGKKLHQLTMAEMAMLAGLPQAPSRNNPLRSPKRALMRRNHVLQRMLEVRFIDQNTYEKAIHAPLTAKYHDQRVAVSAPYMAEMVRQVAISEYGEAAYERGLDVYTTIDARYQTDAARALRGGLIAYSERHGYRKSTQNLGDPTEENRTAWESALHHLDRLHLLHPVAILDVNDKTAQALMADGDVIAIPWSGLSWARPAYRQGFVGPLPRHARDVLKQGDVVWMLKTKKGWRLSQIPRIQGAIISIDPQNGAILALAGGFDYLLSNFNRATQARRQPGSNFKPFLYSAALAKDFTLASIINDAPIVMRDTGENQLWRPNNDTLRFYGPTRLREGLTHSRNLVSIRLLRAMGIPYAREYVQRFGFQKADLPSTLSLALGSGLVTPLDIVSGYAIFANGGYRIQPHFIQKIIDDENSKPLFLAQPPKACEACFMQNQNTIALPDPIAQRVITPQNAYLMTKALQNVIQHGTGRAVKVLKRMDLAGKTGTTNNKVDAWFSGFNSHIVTTVWVGFDNSKSMHEYGAQAALPIWIQYMRTVLSGLPEHTMPEPSDIITVRIDPRTGLLARPNQSNAVFEVFRKEHQPKQFAAPHNAAISSVATGQHRSSSEPLF